MDTQSRGTVGTVHFQIPHLTHLKFTSVCIYNLKITYFLYLLCNTGFNVQVSRSFFATIFSPQVRRFQCNTPPLCWQLGSTSSTADITATIWYIFLTSDRQLSEILSSFNVTFAFCLMSLSLKSSRRRCVTASIKEAQCVTFKAIYQYRMRQTCLWLQI